MRIKQLKLAGFKSFVDPTVVPFPSQLVAVVGPNGCGKSNVIDAVRWVMGESSAKSLRGESMADVIFNGSSNRKALGQASVELVFDNSMGRLSGQFASYQEIAVKRVVTRDGDSFYFLNGTRCRRKDITDIFLGTGAGARGYSIIGQGTISRLVEARPEELRAYLEEAAGVSKYKERRRETLTRISHTRENLARVADIREELGKQLHRLERQARAAERYQILKAEERSCKADILALKWQVIDKEKSLAEQDLLQNSLIFEQHQAKTAESSKHTTLLREKIQEQQDHLQALQASFYKLGTEIARLEESIQQRTRDKQRLINDHQQLQDDALSLSAQLQQDRLNLQDSQANLEGIIEQLESARGSLADKQQAFHDTERQQVAWQAQSEQTQKILANIIRETEVAKVSLANQLQRRQETQVRLEIIHEEQQDISEGLTSGVPEEQYANREALQTALRQAEGACQSLQAKGDSVNTQLADTETKLEQEQDNLYRLKTGQAELSAIIKAKMGQEDHEPPTSAQWSHLPRLIEVMSVDNVWQQACEFVLEGNLKAIVIDSMASIWSDVAMLNGVSGILTTHSTVRTKTGNFPRLSDKIKGVVPCSPHVLDKIITAANLEEACGWLPQIQEDESIITPDCCWMGKGWVKVTCAADQEPVSLLAIQEQLTAMNQSVINAENDVSRLKLQRNEWQLVIKDNKDAFALAQQNVSDIRENLRNCEATISNQERILQQLSTNAARLADEYSDLTSRLEDMVMAIGGFEQTIQENNTARLAHDSAQEQLLVDKSRWEVLLLSTRQELEEARSALHKLELGHERELSLVRQSQNNIERDQLRLETLTERLEANAQELLAAEVPDCSLNDDLVARLSQHNELDATLASHRQQLDLFMRDMAAAEADMKEGEKQAKAVGEEIQQQQLKIQTLLVRASSLVESLGELGVELNVVRSTIPEAVCVADRDNLLLDIVEKIKRLGPINLAAIEEYGTELQRKQYLDEQYDDLVLALNTLEVAIEKMDKETTQRLQQTFDDVNRGFQALFPRLFGGGRAMLELTCDNLLEAGILVMAQPPGKRNSTIHLLSGGEKAMTAVALVFAIFQLNPSPFCMLDEVDAPLDDVNVGRFCALVKEMSQFVQFLFISHNKVTMELADHLIGVTMCEPGVSRIVAVDVEQALALT